MRHLTLFCFLFGSLILFSPPSFAQDKWFPLKSLNQQMTPGQVKNPRFKKGDTRINFFVEGNQLDSMLNGELSTACVLGLFNQIKRRRFFVNIRMPDNSVRRFGYANGYGYNLRDQNYLRIEKEAYLFDLDGTSQCKVYSIATPG